VVGALYLLIALAFRSAWAMPVSGTTGVPLEALASQVRGGGVVVSILAPVAAAGALVSLMAGIGRTAMAMARHSDLPRLLARQGATGAPWIAEGASALVSVALAWAGDLALALATSACCVLVYYAIANLAAVRQSLAHRTVSWRLPPVVSMLGAVLCGILAVSLPLVAVLAAAGALGAALLIRAVLGPALR
jgi:APA family basic amino acid/polyamine antiporter